MHSLSRLVVAAAVILLPAGVALAQGAPAGGIDTGGTTSAPEAATAEKEKAAPKKKKPARMTRQQEINRSIDRGTVPARYRNSVPKEYHQYIPFDKR
jgi:hypothetical protein